MPLVTVHCSLFTEQTGKLSNCTDAAALLLLTGIQLILGQSLISLLF